VKKAKEPLVLLNLDREEEEPDHVEPAPAEAAGDRPAVIQAPPAPAFETLQRPFALADLLRALLIVISLFVALGLVLVLLPQNAVDGLAQRLLARHQASRPEKIAFLYLGDRLADNAFTIRGVVRNISAEPIEQLDATLRLYAHDGSILETTVVRMNKNTIAPGEIAQFELVYPDYRQDFGSYSVEFKLRQGAVLPYKDMRAPRSVPVD